MSIPRLVIKGDTTAMVDALEALTRYSELFGDAAQERINGFLSSLNSLSEMFTIEQHSTSAMGTQDVLLVFKPSELLLEFLAAMAVDFNVNVEQGFHDVHSQTSIIGK